MQPRGTNSIDMMIAQAIEKMRELKELQFFGGDALNLKRWTQTFNIAPDLTKHCWRIVMTPENANTTMPFDAIVKPANAISYAYGQIERVHRTDGAFEFLLITGANFDVTPIPIKVSIEYTGAAAFTVTQLG